MERHVHRSEHLGIDPSLVAPPPRGTPPLRIQRAAGYSAGSESYARHRTDGPGAVTYPCGSPNSGSNAHHILSPGLTDDAEACMSNELVETGWKRFLERLKRLWGRLRDPDVPSATAATAVAGTSANHACVESAAPHPGST